MRTPSLVLALASLGMVALVGTLEGSPGSTWPGAQERGPWAPTTEEVQLADEVRVLLNDARDEAALPVLGQHPLLDRFAYQHAREMATRGSVTHHSHWYGMSTSTRFKLAFPGVYQFGENVAVNRRPQELHRALMESAGHRLNRMDPAFTHVGLAVARAGDHQVYLAEVFVRVANESALAEIDVLYTELPPPALPPDEPNYGEVRGETVRIGRPREDNPEFWTQRGIDAFNGGRYEEAVGLFQRSIEIDSTYEYAYYNLARAHLANSEPGPALEILQRLTEKDPDDADAWSSTGTALLLLQRADEAVDAFSEVLRLRARDAGSWYNLGLAHEMQGSLDIAERAYRQALHVDPALTEAAAALARITR